MRQLFIYTLPPFVYLSFGRLAVLLLLVRCCEKAILDTCQFPRELVANHWILYSVRFLQKTLSRFCNFWALKRKEQKPLALIFYSFWNPEIRKNIKMLPWPLLALLCLFWAFSIPFYMVVLVAIAKEVRVKQSNLSGSFFKLAMSLGVADLYAVRYQNFQNWCHHRATVSVEPCRSNNCDSISGGCTCKKCLTYIA